MPHVGGTFDWWLERVHPADRDRFSREVQAFLGSADRQVVLQYRLRRGGGEYVPVTDQVAVERARDGTPIRLVALVEERVEEETPVRPRTPYEVLFERTGDAVYHVGPSGRLRDFNAAFLGLVTRSRAAALGRPLSEFVEGGPEFEDLVDALLERGEVAELEVAVVDDDGGTHTALLSAVATLGSNGEYLGHHGILQVVPVEDDEPEEPEPVGEVAPARGLTALIEIFRRLSIVDRMDAATVRDIVGLIPEGCRVPELARGRVVLGGFCLSADGFDPARSATCPVTSGGERLGSVSVSYPPAESGSQEPDFVEAEMDFLSAVAACVGETARRIAAEARDADAADADDPPYGAWIRMSGDLMAILDGDGALRFASAAAERLLGYQPVSLLGKKALDLVHPSDVPAVRGAVERGAASQVGFVTVRHRVQHADGSWRYFETVGQAVLDDSDDTYVVLNCRDVSERMVVEAQLALSNQREVVGRLAGGIAHEFNNLLTVIQMNTRLLADDLGFERAPEELSEILDAAASAAVLTRRLIAFSGGGIVEPRSLELGQLVQHFEPLLVKVMGGGVRVELERGERPLPIVADARQVEQVLRELSENAREAMPTGGRLTIEVRAADFDDLPPQLRHPEDWALLRVSDTGNGMSAEVRQEIFEPFFTTKSAGTGLGLATVRDIVARLGGRIDLTTSSGEGSTFTVLLPLDRGEERVVPEAERAPTVPTPAAPSARTILLVAADRLTRSVAERALAERGHRVLEAEHGVGALTMIEAFQGTLDLLVTSVEMPDVEAEALAARVLALHPEARVLYLGEDGTERLEGPTLPSDALLGVLVETVDALLGDPE